MRNLLCSTFISLSLVLGTGLFGDLNSIINQVLNIDKPQTEITQETKKEIINSKPTAAEPQTVEKPALNGYIIASDKGPLDISQKGILFINTDINCYNILEILETVKDLPEEKKPFIFINSGTAEQTEYLFKEMNLTEEYYYCKGKSPVDTIPSFLFVENEEIKKYTCSVITDKLIERTYPRLLSSIELPNAAGPSGHNAEQAAKSINGTVIEPNKEFSFYEHVGIPSVERGYQVGTSLMRTPTGTVTIPDVGGGICRTSTVINFAVKECPGLKVTERHCHSMPVSYASPGEDTAVARSSGWDYRFVNNREKPIRIKAYEENDSLKIEIWELYKA